MSVMIKKVYQNPYAGPEYINYSVDHKQSHIKILWGGGFYDRGKGSMELNAPAFIVGMTLSSIKKMIKLMFDNWHIRENQEAYQAFITAVSDLEQELSEDLEKCKKAYDDHKYDIAYFKSIDSKEYKAHGKEKREQLKLMRECNRQYENDITVVKQQHERAVTVHNLLTEQYDKFN